MSRLAVVPILVLFAAGLMWPGRARAQGNVQVDLSTTAIVFATPGIADFDAGWIDHGGVTVSVQSRPANRPWELRLGASTGTLGAGKPIGDLEWRRAGTGTWTPMTQLDTAVLQGTGNQDVTIYFRLLLSWARDPPGSYSAGLEFTALRI